MKISKYRRTKPETPGSRIYWNAYLRWEEYCKERARASRSTKPFFRFIIDEIDLALRTLQPAKPAQIKPTFCPHCDAWCGCGYMEHHRNSTHLTPHNP